MQQLYDAGGAGHADARTVLRFEVPRTMEGVAVVENLDDLLKVAGAQVREPARYVIVATRTQSGAFGHVETMKGGKGAPWVCWQAVSSGGYYRGKSSGRVSANSKTPSYRVLVRAHQREMKRLWPSPYLEADAAWLSGGCSAARAQQHRQLRRRERPRGMSPQKELPRLQKHAKN